jgi:hypothetical protein
MGQYISTLRFQRKFMMHYCGPNPKAHISIVAFGIALPASGWTVLLPD